MRSLLFVPADSGRKLDKAMASGADAVIIDLEDSIARRPQGRGPHQRGWFSERRRQRESTPSPASSASTALQTDLTDDDLDAIVPARPDAIMLPKAEGGAPGRSCRRQADGARSELREWLTAISRSSRMAIETAASLFLAGTYGASARA